MDTFRMQCRHEPARERDAVVYPQGALSWSHKERDAALGPQGVRCRHPYNKEHAAALEAARNAMSS